MQRAEKKGGQRAGQRFNWLGVIGTGVSRKPYAPVCSSMSCRPSYIQKIAITLANPPEDTICGGW